MSEARNVSAKTFLGKKVERSAKEEYASNHKIFKCKTDYACDKDIDYTCFS